MKGLFILLISSLTGLLFGQIKTEYTRIFPFREGFARVVKDGKVGFIDTNLKEVIPCMFHWANNFIPKIKIASFTDTTGLFGFVDMQGNIIVEPKYSDVYEYCHGTEMIYVVKNGKYGWMNKNGVEVIPCIYEQTTTSPESFYNGLVRAEYNGKTGILDSIGNVILDFRYHSLKLEDRFYNTEAGFPEQFMAAMKDSTFCYIDTSFNFVIPPLYKYGENFHEGRTMVRNDEYKSGVINTSGDTIVDFIYNDISEYKDGVAQVQINGTEYEKDKKYPSRIGDRYGFINQRGKEITKIIYKESPSHNHDIIYNHIELRKNDTCLLINKRGKRKSKKYYKNIGFMDFYRLCTDVVIDEVDNYALGYRDSLFYAINRKGREINKVGSKEMIFFYNGLALIRNKEEKVGFINTKGKVVIPFDYEIYFFYHFIDDHSILKKNGKFGMIDTSNNEVIPFEYDYLYHYSGGYAVAKKDDNYLLLNGNAEVVLTSQ